MKMTVEEFRANFPDLYIFEVRTYYDVLVAIASTSCNSPDSMASWDNMASKSCGSSKVSVIGINICKSANFLESHLWYYGVGFADTGKFYYQDNMDDFKKDYLILKMSNL